MEEIIWEIMTKEYREEDHEKKSVMMEDLYEFLIEFMDAVRRRAIYDGGRPFCTQWVSPLQAAHHQFKFSPVTSV